MSGANLSIAVHSVWLVALTVWLIALTVRLRRRPSTSTPPADLEGLAQAMARLSEEEARELGGRVWDIRHAR